MAKSPSTPGATAVHLLHGSDEFAISERARAVLNTIAAGRPLDDALELIEAKCGGGAEVETAVGRAISGLMTPSMFSPFKVIWLREANWLPEKAMSKWETVKTQIDRLAALIEKGLPPGCHLLITSEAVSQRSAFLKACKAGGEVVELGLPDKPWEVEKEMKVRAAQMLRERGIEFEDHLPDKIIDRLGGDPRLLHTEIEKLDVYLGDRRTLDEEDVVLMVPILRELAPWDLADAIAQRNLPKAFSQLEQMMHQRLSDVAIIASLENRFRELALYRECLDRGFAQCSGSGNYAKVHWKDENARQLVAATLGGKPKHPFMEAKAFVSTLSFSSAELTRARRLIADTHENLFRSGLPKRQLFELLILKILGTGTPAGR